MADADDEVGNRDVDVPMQGVSAELTPKEVGEADVESVDLEGNPFGEGLQQAEGLLLVAWLPVRETPDHHAARGRLRTGDFRISRFG